MITLVLVCTTIIWLAYHWELVLVALDTMDQWPVVVIGQKICMVSNEGRPAVQAIRTVTRTASVHIRMIRRTLDTAVDHQWTRTVDDLSRMLESHFGFDDLRFIYMFISPSGAPNVRVEVQPVTRVAVTVRRPHSIRIFRL